MAATFPTTRAFFLFPSSSSPFKTFTLFPKPSSIISPYRHRYYYSSSSDQPPLTSEQAILEAISQFESTETFLPAIRTFENSLSRFSLIGAVDFHLALTAAAADGGSTADEHLSSNLPSMVIETLSPGPSDDLSTISTRLFLPTKKVKEKSRKLNRSMMKDIIREENASSKNILAMTFRQVVLRHLWSFELELFRPGTIRDMNDLENARDKVPVMMTVSSSDERVVSRIGEVVCLAAVGNVETLFRHGGGGGREMFGWFNERSRISSEDESVVLYNLLEREVVSNAKMLLEKFELERGASRFKGAKLKNSWWGSPAFSKLEKIGGVEFCAWISECVPSYLLRIDGGKLGDVKFEGWKESEANSWEVVLTHSQMVSLADILDMYYEDVYTLPNKRLACRPVAKPPSLARNKGGSLLKIFSIVLASGIFILAISVLRKLYLPNRKIYTQNSQPQVSEVSCVPLQSLESSKLDECCVSIIRRIKDSCGWPSEIETKPGNSAWVGELPTYLRNVDDNGSYMLGNSSTSTPLGESDKEMKALEDIASYQVVLSTDGNIMGFQPTNRLAVNNWAVHPLAEDLYGGKHLSPGLLEPGLKVSYPSGVAVLELLMSKNPNSYFALVRAVDISGQI